MIHARKDRVLITTYKGYDIYYLKGDRMFEAYVTPPEGEEVGNDNVARAVLQEDIEQQIDKLVKANLKSEFKFPFPIPCIESAWNSEAVYGKITSINPNHQTCRMTVNGNSQEKGWYGSRDDIFEVTPVNEVIVKQLQAIKAKIDKLHEFAKQVREGFEKPINKAYFGMPEERRRY